MNEKKIIQIASNTNYFGLKGSLPLKAKVKNKVCGDEIEIETNKDLTEIRFEAQSCIFTQASAAILSNNIKIIRKHEINKILQIIKKKLDGEKVELPFNIRELDFLTHKDHKTRKECIALPFNAVIKATDD